MQQRARPDWQKLVEDATEPENSTEVIRGTNHIINSPIGNGSIVNSTVIVHARDGVERNREHGYRRGRRWRETMLAAIRQRAAALAQTEEQILEIASVELRQSLIVLSLEGLEERELEVYNGLMKRKLE